MTAQGSSDFSISETLSPPPSTDVCCCHHLLEECAHCTVSFGGMRSAWDLAMQAHGSIDGSAGLLDRDHSAEACR